MSVIEKAPKVECWHCSEVVQMNAYEDTFCPACGSLMPDVDEEADHS